MKNIRNNLPNQGKIMPYEAYIQLSKNYDLFDYQKWDISKKVSFATSYQYYDSIIKETSSVPDLDSDLLKQYIHNATYPGFIAHLCEIPILEIPKNTNEKLPDNMLPFKKKKDKNNQK